MQVQIDNKTNVKNVARKGCQYISPPQKFD